MCGEYLGDVPAPVGPPGSPPRVRGILVRPLTILGLSRITPACAGNTDRGKHPSCRERDHPRVCGEYPGKKGKKECRQGSPPRVRGIQQENSRKIAEKGITPACAGNTWGMDSARVAARDHPRVCGEYSASRPKSRRLSGSPPRVRGIHLCFKESLKIKGITPACAGNTIYSSGTLSSSQDHPRVCGEYAPMDPSHSSSLGSPPRVRGIHPSVISTSLYLGITPACAGNTH